MEGLLKTLYLPVYKHFKTLLQLVDIRNTAEVLKVAEMGCKWL